MFVGRKRDENPWRFGCHLSGIKSQFNKNDQWCWVFFWCYEPYLKERKKKACLENLCLRPSLRSQVQSYTVNVCLIHAVRRIDLPTDQQRVGLCICFWPLLNISRWLKDPQSNHIHFFKFFFCLGYVTHWTSTPNVPMSSNAVTTEGFLLNLFWNDL